MQDEKLCLRIKGVDRPLFSGVIEELSVTSTGKFYEVKVSCSSYTSLWDRMGMNHSYQDHSMRFKDVLEKAKALAGIRGRLMVTAEEAYKEIGKPVYQYEETLWQFVKRIAGRCNTLVIPEVTYDLPQLCVGCVNGRYYEAGEQQEYKKVIDIEKMIREKGERKKNKYIHYCIYSRDNFQLGDRILFQGNQLRVMEKELKLENGLTEGCYTLGYEEGFSLENSGKTKLKGASFRGNVINTKEGMVKVHLDMDPEQSEEKAWWYQYAPVTGDIMYSVPELGAKVLLTIMDEGDEAVVSGCIREDSKVLPGPEVKNFWVKDKKYIAAPEYMGFSSEKQDTMEALFLDDKIGIVIQTGEDLKWKAKGQMVLHAGNKITFQSTTEMEWKNPMAEEEQAWMRMNCGKMRFGGRSILQSGLDKGRSMECEGDYVSISENECADIAMGMIPLAWNEGVGEDIEEVLDMAVVNNYKTLIFPSKEESKKDKKKKEPKLRSMIVSGVETIFSNSNGEKKALIYAKGKEFKGYVLNGKTYVENYDDFLPYAFDMGLREVPWYRDSDLESTVKVLGVDEVFSSWEQSRTLRIVICNWDARTAHLKIKRRGELLKIHVFIALDFVKVHEKYDEEEKPDPYTQRFTGEKNKGTAAEICEKGVKLWEGVYCNRKSEDTGIIYDDFGMDGLVNVHVEVSYENEYREKNNIPSEINLIEGEGKNEYQKFAYTVLFDNKKEMEVSVPFSGGGYAVKINYYNRSSVSSEIQYGYREKILILLFRYYWIYNLESEKGKKFYRGFTDFLHTIAHEFGHVFGLGDAYDRTHEEGNKAFKYMVGAKITDEIPQNSMMISNKIIMPNDIEMIIEAWKTAQKQRYYDAEKIGYEKSKVIRQERKDRNFIEKIFE